MSYGLSTNSTTNVTIDFGKEEKSLTLQEREILVSSLYKGEGYPCGVYDHEMIVSKGIGNYFAVPYVIKADAIVEYGEPRPVTKEWVTATAVQYGDNSLKALEVTDKELVVGNYLILFNQRDLTGYQYPHLEAIKFNPDGVTTGEYFDPEVDIESEYLKAGKVFVDWEHGRDPDRIGNNPSVIIGKVDEKSLRRDEIGIYAKRVLDRSHAYMAWLEELIQAGEVGSSTKAIPGSSIKDPDGRIKRWALERDTLTVTPMDWRMKGKNVVQILEKATQIDLSIDKSADSVTDDGAIGSGGLEKGTQITIRNNKTMPTQLDAILASNMSNEDKAALIRSLGEQPAPTSPAPLTEEGVKSVVLNTMKASGFGTRQAPTTTLPMSGTDVKSQGTDEKAALSKYLYQARFGSENEAKAAILTDVIGPNYRDILMEQERAFAKFVRKGENKLTLAEEKALKTQIYPLEDILAYVYDKGMDVKEIKATQVEAQGDLGGFAVPPQRQAQMIKRMRGLTAVRQAGAQVIQLVNSNAADFLEYSGGTDQYVGALRGVWGGEGASATEKNFTLATESVPAHVYTYQVKLSQSLVDDAANLIDTLIQDIADTLAIDEDIAFLTGNGIKKPLGILPGGVNPSSTDPLHITEVVTGSAAALTIAGIKALKRGIASQYRAGAVWVANSDTYSEIEQFTWSTGPWAFPDLSESEMLLARKAYESEAMPDVGAGTYPLLFGNMRGYGIVERLGLSIERFHDSNTGPNQTWFGVSRRVGGRVLYPWMFAVQKCST